MSTIKEHFVNGHSDLGDMKVRQKKNKSIRKLV